MTKRRTTICLSVAAVIVAVAVIFLILGVTVFKAKDPITTVDSVALKDLDFSVDVRKPTVHLTAVIETAVTVTNPNVVGFKYANSSALLTYRGKEVGQAPIPAGEIGGGAARGMNMTLTLMADRLVGDSHFFTDVVAGTLALRTDVRLPGKVQMLVGVPAVAYAACDLEIHLASRGVKQTCHYKTKL
ncbi:hypothetical protein ABFX02_08G170400 [Erythranthe guttata]